MGSTLVGKTQIDFSLESPESLTREKNKDKLENKTKQEQQKIMLHTQWWCVSSWK